jgi:chemotaxis protein MotB
MSFMKMGNRARKISSGRITPLLAMLLFVIALAVPAGAQSKDKKNNKDSQSRSLADYVRRMGGAGPVASPSTLGSLWVDNGRMANLVADYASSQVDKRKVGKLALAIQVAFQELGVFPASTTQIPIDVSEPMPFSTVQAIQNVSRNTELGRIAPSPQMSLSGASDESDLATLQQQLQDALHGEIVLRQVALRRQSDGLVVSLREFGFFDSGSATIKPQALPALDRIASILAVRTYKLRIEGHTDNVPIHTAQMSSNWELSTARATELIRILITRHNFAPERLSAVGYAEYHPIASNLTAQGRAQNRRVDIVILNPQTRP